jgi:fibronectin-binding autotransporter adhesin
VELVDATVSQNRRSGIVLEAGTLTMRGGSIVSNKNEPEVAPEGAPQPGHGGGVNVIGGSITLKDLTIRDNRVSGQGGGIRNQGSATLENVIVEGNNAHAEGGGIANDRTLTMTGGRIDGNTGRRGGGIFTPTTSSVTQNPSATLTNVGLNGNTASAGHGGGVYYGSGRLTLTETSLVNNQAIGTDADGNLARGGGIYVVGRGSLVMIGGAIRDNNRAPHGGGIANVAVQ